MEKLSPNEELKYLGQMLYATTVDEKKRIKTIINRIKKVAQIK